MKTRSILKVAAIAAAVAFLPVASFILAVLFFPLTSLAQSPEPESAHFAVTDAQGKVAGLYEFNQVIREEGVFATSRFFKGQKALTAKKKGTPDLRSYLELSPERTFSKYTRWLTSGISVREFKLFRYQKEIRIRVALDSSGKVSTVGKWQPVFLIEEDMPHTAALLVDRLVPERKVACINTTLGKIGQATIRVVGVRSVEVVAPTSPAVPVADSPASADTGVADGPERNAPATVVDDVSREGEKVPATAVADAPPVNGDVYEFRVEGDCGTISVWQDGAGNFIRFANPVHTFEPVAK